MMNSKLKVLLKAKGREATALDVLVSHLCRDNAALNKKEIGGFLDELLVDIRGKISRGVEAAVILEEVRSRVDTELGVALDLTALSSIYEKTALEFIAESGVEAAFSFGKVDTKALTAIRQGFFWMKDDHSKALQDALKDKIEAAFRGEVAREDLPALLRDEFGGILQQETFYFKGVTDHIISQGQNLARVAQGEKYGVKYYKVVARMDERTTQICRSMNGRIIPANHVEKQAGKIRGAGDLESKKRAASWMDGAYLKKDLPSSFGIPPYHFRCRTILQPVWLREEEIEVDGEKVTVRNTGQFPGGKDGVVMSHVDGVGVERIVGTEVYTHESHSKKPGVKKVRGALNSIDRIAPHKDDPARVVATSRNGYFMVFEGEKVVTVFEPGKNKIDNYFKRNAVAAQKEVIKWRKESCVSGSIRGIIGKLLKSNI